MSALRQPSLLFPPTADGVLVPRDDRACALLGITMYTASRRSVLLAQRAAHASASVVGLRVLPARRDEVVIEEWSDLTDSWHETLGDVDSVAMYQRRDPRAGVTMLACRGGVPVALIKCRHGGAGLAAEQQALARLEGRSVAGLSFPVPLGHGVSAEGVTWAAQEFVFRRPHRPVLSLDQGQLDALSAAIAEACAGLDGEQPGDDMELAHRDLTPWNLRRDHRGKVWLIDWEDVGWAPRGADAGYLALAASALRRGRGRPVMEPRVADFWRARVRDRVVAGHDAPINARMLRLLDEIQE